MATYGFAAPILPGKLTVWKQRAQEMKTTRKAELEASRKRANVTKEEVWLQQTPVGDFAIVSLEAADIGAAFQRFFTSTDPFDVWFRDNILVDVHGMKPNEPPPPMNERII